MRTLIQVSKREVTKLVSLLKGGTNISVVSSPHKFSMIEVKGKKLNKKAPFTLQQLLKILEHRKIFMLLYNLNMLRDCVIIHAGVNTNT